MSLSALLLAIYLFFQAAAYLGWFTVNALVMGILALVTAILLIVDTAPTIQKRYFVK